jgi:IS4 transposase
MTLSTFGPFLSVGINSNPYVGNNGPAAGMVRFNTNTQSFEAYDGSVWIRMAVDQNISLTADAVEAIHWARRKLQQEEQLKKLADQHPGVADAVQQLQRASEQLEIMVKLVKEEV